MDTPDISATQTDIGFANNYRIELIKHGLVFSVGIFAFTVSAFLLSAREMPKEASWLACLYIGWAALLVSTLCGLAHLYAWEAIYISYRDYDYKAGKVDDDTAKKDIFKAGEAHRTKIHGVRKAVRVGQFGGLILGAVLVAIFAGKVLLL